MQICTGRQNHSHSHSDCKGDLLWTLTQFILHIPEWKLCNCFGLCVLLFFLWLFTLSLALQAWHLMSFPHLTGKDTPGYIHYLPHCLILWSRICNVMTVCWESEKSHWTKYPILLCIQMTEYNSHYAGCTTTEQTWNGKSPVTFTAFTPGWEPPYQTQTTRGVSPVLRREPLCWSQDVDWGFGDMSGTVSLGYKITLNELLH